MKRHLESKRRREERLRKLKDKYITPFSAAGSTSEAAVTPADRLAGVHAEGDEERHESAGEDWIDSYTGGQGEEQVVRDPVDEQILTSSEDEGEVRIRNARIELGLSEYMDSAVFSDPVLQETGELPDVDEVKENVAMISKFFVALQARREVPFRVMIDIVEFLRSRSKEVGEVLHAGALPAFRVMRERAVKQAPKVKVDVLCEDEEGDKVEFKALSRYPRKEVRERNLVPQYSLYYVSLADVWNWHAASHKEKGSLVSRVFDVSLDGVPESRSSGLSFDVLSVRFTDCESIYSIAVMQPGKKGMGSMDSITIQHLLQDLSQSDLRIRYVIADAPKRASLQGLKTHAGTFGCPYCVARKEEGKFSSSSFGSEPRSDAALRRSADAIAAGGPEEFGVKGPSPLQHVPGLDLIRHVPAEPMHLIFLGVVRKMIRFMYKNQTAGPKQMCKLKERADVAPLNGILAKAQGLTDFSRRPRDLDVAVYKAEEYRNLTLAYWPAVMDTCPARARKLWLLTVYLVRAYCLPDKFFADLDGGELRTQLIRQWYELFEATFGIGLCTYNVHVFSHIGEVRSINALSEVSACAFEDQYAILKKNYRPGTTSLGSQALTTCNLAHMTGHRCRRKKELTLTQTKRVNDRYLYLKDGRILLATNLDGNVVRGRLVPKMPTRGLIRGLDFADVLCFYVDLDNVGPDDQRAEPTDVLGKCVVVLGLASVVTWSMNRL